MPVEIPQQDGQYLRFIQMPDGETRLEAARNIGKVTKVISGYPGFSVATNVFPDVSPLVVRIKDCGLISFTKLPSGKTSAGRFWFASPTASTSRTRCARSSDKTRTSS